MGFFWSGEFQGQISFLTHREYVYLLYVRLFKREPDPAGHDGWTAALDYRAIGRAQMFGFFVRVPEFLWAYPEFQ